MTALVILTAALSAAALALALAPPARLSRALPRVGRRHGRRSGARADVLSLLDVAVLAERVAALVRAGVPAPRAWSLLGELPGPCRGACLAVSGALTEGRSVADGLLLALAQSGGERRSMLRLAGRWESLRSPPHGRPAAGASLGWLAVALDVTTRAGAPTADVLDAFAVALRAHESAGQEVGAALEGSKATARLLSFLPLAGIGLGALVGGDPVGVLLTTPPGHVCLVLGASLWAAGRWWTGRLVAAATRSAPT